MPAFSGLLAPYWRDDARGILVGISGGTNKHHFARAVLESMAFQTYDVLHTIKTEAGIPVPILRVDGGASQNNLLMQLQVCSQCLLFNPRYEHKHAKFSVVVVVVHAYVNQKYVLIPCERVPSALQP